MKVIGFIVLLVFGLVVDAALLLWWGRVLFPSLGLGVPDFWTWFWSLMPVAAFLFLGAIIGGVAKETVSVSHRW